MILLRYFITQIFQATLSVTLVLLLIVMSGRLAKYLSDASAGEIAANAVLSVIIFRIPDFLPLILPLGLFVGVLLAYGRMYVDSEMVVAQACGVGKLRLLMITLIPAVLIASAVAWLTLVGAPASLQKVQSILHDPEHRQGLAVLQKGKFQSDRLGNAVSYTENIVAASATLEGVRIFEFRDNQSMRLITAEFGRRIENGSHGEYFVLSNGSVYEGLLSDSDQQVASFTSYAQKIKTYGAAEKRQLKVDALPTVLLLGSEDARHQAALHWRYSLPVVAMVVALIALALSKTNHRSGRYAKMLPAILIYLIYLVSITGARNLIEDESFGTQLYWLVHGVFLMLGLVLLLFEDVVRYWTVTTAAK